MTAPFDAAWYYNSRQGTISHITKAIGDVLLKTGAGYHGPFATEGDAFAFYDNNRAANPGWKSPYGPGGVNSGTNFDPVGQTQQQLNSDVNQVAGGVKSSILGGVNLEIWFLRIGEILLGIVLVGVALAHLSGTDNIVSKAVKVGKFL